MKIIKNDKKYNTGKYRAFVKLGSGETFLYFKTEHELRDYLKEYMPIGTLYEIHYWDGIYWLFEGKGEVK